VGRINPSFAPLRPREGWSQFPAVPPLRTGGKWIPALAGVTAMLLAACNRTPPTPPTPGERLEAAAVAAGLVTDPATAPIAGSWARDTGRMCIVPAGGGDRLGVLLDYGDRQGCAGSGTVERHGDRLRVALGDCRFDARYDGEHITLPAQLPPACEAMCTGRATLAALEVDRIGTSVSEASQLRTPRGQLLCSS